jgi:hypothetical protein
MYYAETESALRRSRCAYECDADYARRVLGGARSGRGLTRAGERGTGAAGHRLRQAVRAGACVQGHAYAISSATRPADTFSGGHSVLLLKLRVGAADVLMRWLTRVRPGTQQSTPTNRSMPVRAKTRRIVAVLPENIRARRCTRLL